MIYLVRHALDDESYIGGHSDVDLIDYGINQAIELRNWFCEQQFNIDRLYTSDVKRAVTTARIVNEYLNLLIIEDNKLRELDKGILTGMKKELAMMYYPDYVNIFDVNMRYPGGESMMDLYLRIKELLIYFSKYENSILVTHRGVINMIYCILLEEQLDMNKEKYNVEHASVHELDLCKSRIRRIK